MCVAFNPLLIAFSLQSEQPEQLQQICLKDMVIFAWELSPRQIVSGCLRVSARSP